MTISLEEIWDTPMDEMDEQLESENIIIYQLSPVEKYIKFSELYDNYNKLSLEDSKIVRDPLFKFSMLRTFGTPGFVSSNTVTRLSVGLELYKKLISSDENREIIYNSRDPRCLTNNFENNNPIDPIALTPISGENLYVIDKTCYNKESVRALISHQNIDIYRQPISKNVFIDFNIPFFGNGVQFEYFYDPIKKNLQLDHNDINTNILRNIIFPNNLVTLDLSDNLIDSLENIIFPKSLKNFFLDGNPINFSFFFKSINNLSLNILSLENTNIENQTIEFSNNIIKLSLRDNHIETLNNLKFGESLEYLDLVGNNVCNTDINLGDIDVNCG
jgi:hypothetical protein